MIGKAEVCISLNKFANIGFKQQGLYLVRLSIFYTDGDKTTVGFPHLKLTSSNANRSFIRPSIIQSNYYYSPCYNIIYDHDEAIIGDIVIFRVQVEHKGKIKVKGELMRGQMNKEQDYKNFKVLSECICKYNNISRSFSYLPLYFEQKHICFIDSLSTCVMVEYKYKNNTTKYGQDNIEGFLKYFQSTLNGRNQLNLKEFIKYYEEQSKQEFYFLIKLIKEIVAEIGIKIDISKSQQAMSITKHKLPQSLNREISNFQKIKDIFTTKKGQAELFFDNLHKIAKQIYVVWIFFVQFINDNSKMILVHQKKKYKQMVRQKWQRNIFKQQYSKKSQGWNKLSNSKQNAKVAVIRRKNMDQQPDILKIQNQALFPQKSEQPILFYQKQTLTKINRGNIKNPHLIILVHGFQANRFDMNQLKNIFSMAFYGKAQIYCSNSNQGQTVNDILQMGQTLAKQVTNFVGSRTLQNLRISFVGHSMGGLIIRAAIPFLKQEQKSLYSFVSIASPHIGYLYSSKILQAGLWYLNTLQKCFSIKQLSMDDDSELHDTFLYKLSKNGSLNNFKNIMFIGSHQDGYAPYESARVQKTEQIQLDCKKNVKQIRLTRKGVVHSRMVDNILRNVKANSISRLDVNFVLTNSSFIQNMIGRTAHIRFLQQKSLIRMLTSCFDEIFL